MILPSLIWPARFWAVPCAGDFCAISASFLRPVWQLPFPAVAGGSIARSHSKPVSGHFRSFSVIFGNVLVQFWSEMPRCSLKVLPGMPRCIRKNFILSGFQWFLVVSSGLGLQKNCQVGTLRCDVHPFHGRVAVLRRPSFFPVSPFRRHADTPPLPFPARAGTWCQKGPNRAKSCQIVPNRIVHPKIGPIKIQKTVRFWSDFGPLFPDAPPPQSAISAVSPFHPFAVSPNPRARPKPGIKKSQKVLKSLKLVQNSTGRVLRTSRWRSPPSRNDPVLSSALVTSKSDRSKLKNGPILD